MRKRWWIIGGATLLVVLGIGGYLALGNSGPSGLPVNIAEVTQGDLHNEVLTSGKAQVDEETTLYANGSGILREFTIKEGTSVQKGQRIGSIDTSDVDSKILAMEAQIEAQQANLAKSERGKEPEIIAQQREKVKQEELNVAAAQKEWQRVGQLYSSGAVTAQEMEKARDALSQAQSTLTVAKQELALEQKGAIKEDLQAIQAQIKQLQVEKAQLEKERRESVLLAPATGTVLKVSANNGQHVSDGTEILTIGNLADIVVEAEVNESDVHKLKVNQEATVTGSSLGQEKLKARIERIAPIAVSTQSSSGEGEQTRVKVTLRLVQQSVNLKPGYHVDINILTGSYANAVQVPIEAVQQESDGSSFVWSVENGLAKKRKIEVGVENELFLQVTNGLKQGDQVITTPPEGLTDNLPVIPSAGEAPSFM